ncbi:serine carboxypeptidase S28-domain-containing protein [Aspergillus coremiiformis]|uniref:Serine carboxypeptidase S28-domain-containing protein n=1 Tax=Aspergillus coremiiformis TaxID=138285 RepID=A0A5N6ZDV2_9EURO|nr:serine carboxypeptidase S28-domain-containing protein [Aspergillus coremiiformis]
MRIYLTVVSLALLAGPAMGLGLFGASRYMRELQLAAELNLNPDIISTGKTLHSALAQTSAKNSVAAEYIKIPIDHNDTSAGTYSNRFWVNDDYYEAGRPIIMYDAGETNAESIAQSHLTSDLSFFKKILEKQHAIGIVWEHRYYGNSTPFPISRDTPPEHFKYLTTKQALEDIPYFAQNFSRPKFSNLDLTPSSTPWVLVGGSYAGIRAAFARNDYPDVIFAAYSSSAPVQAQVNMSIYYDQVYRGMVGHGHENCTKDIHAALSYIDRQLSKNSTAAAIKKRFFGTGAEKNSNEGFTTALVTIYNYFQNYGVDGPKESLHNFCNYLEVDPITKQPAGPDGVAKLHGNKYVAERWAAWPEFTPLVNAMFETNCRGLNSSQALSCVLNMVYTDPDAISWTWQYCTEWGFYQSNNVGPHSLLSRYQTLGYQQNICNNQFAQAVANGILPPQAQTEALNKEFGGWTIRPSNTYFTGGEFDPWRTLSILTSEEIAPGVAPPGITVSTEIPNCGETNQDKVFGYILKGSEHCYDFHAFSTEGKAARDLFQQALTKWLPCFKASKESKAKTQ